MVVTAPRANQAQIGRRGPARLPAFFVAAQGALSSPWAACACWVRVNNRREGHADASSVGGLLPVPSAGVRGIKRSIIDVSTC